MPKNTISTSEVKTGYLTRSELDTLPPGTIVRSNIGGLYIRTDGKRYVDLENGEEVAQYIMSEKFNKLFTDIITITPGK